MGHSTSSGRQSGQERELRNAVQNGDLERAERIQNAIDRGTMATAAERRAVSYFMENARENLNSERGQQIAANEFAFVGMSNEQAVDIMNAMSRDRYEIYEERQRGNFWTNGAPTIKQYIRKVNAGQSRQGLSESAQRAIRATEYSARQQEEERQRGREAARNMTSRRRR